MLKYYDIIKKLSDSEKIHMLCDITCLSGKNYRALGIPELNITALDEFCGNVYPSPTALANTWDVALTGQIADDLFQKASVNKAGLVKIPSPRVKINPYRQALSEDPLLASSVSQAYLDAAQRADTAVGLADFGLFNEEPEWLDESPDERFIHEFLIKPYADATQNKKCAAILTKENVANQAYGAVNAKLMNAAATDGALKNATPICAKVSAENTVTFLANGGLCFEGSALAVESALSRYKKLTEDVVRGQATTEELNSEITKGKAISPEMLDSAADRMLDFVFSVKRKPNISTVKVNENIALKAAESATVLLKNQGILPIKKGTKIGMIGDIGLCADDPESSFIHTLQEYFSKAGFACAGVERGYDIEKDRSEEIINDALTLAKKCDAVLLFLGSPEKQLKRAHKTRQLAIPANQQELLDRLGDQREKIIAVLSADHTEDICIPEHCAGILLAPTKAKYGAQALANILLGKTSPGGRLASTVYCNTDLCYTKYKTYRERDGLKVGGFIGYRYYDIAEDAPLFPFGHGLGYAKIAYSTLTVNERTVKVELKNLSKVPAVEIVQVYVGIDGSAVLRPRKELGGFARVELKAGEKRIVEIPYKIPHVYDTESAKYVREAGTYTVYVGASVADIRLQQKIPMGGDMLAADHKHLSDYIHSRSNIFTDNYKLEAKIKAMRKSVFNFIAGAMALVLAIALKLFCVTQDLQYAFLDWFTVALGVAGVVFFVAEAIRRNRIRNQEQSTVDRLNEQAFEEAEQIPVYAAQNMFVEEFDTAENIAESETADQVEGVDSEYLQYIEKEQNFENAAAEFELYAAQRGCKFRTDVTKKIFSSLASSRLVVVDGMDDKELMVFMKVLCGYFESDLFIDHVNESYTESDNVLFKADQQGYKSKTNVHLALDAARNARHVVHLATLTNVRCENLPAYFTPYVNYIKNPIANNHVVVLNDRNVETSYYIPQNVWFVLNLAKGERADCLPEFISEVATVNCFEFDNYTVAEQPDAVRKFSYYQMDYLAERASNRLYVDEDAWKKIDRLEEYVASYTPFHIGNKLWLCLERFAYVYLACGGDKVMAVDEAVAAKLMVPVLSKLEGKLTADDLSSVEMIESVLGEDRAEACKRIIHMCSDRKA
ncbi:MAG: glycoside hydrolase family 3 C-terminal domain-containing protein [Clostridia bacterium]|nr:glycoside hydrolase family 3 C-terminal domain-containing protein [Clostridia bacterium]